MDFERIQSKKMKYEQNKHKINAVTLSSYEKDFELKFTHNSTAIEGNTLTLMETKVLLEDGVSIGEKPDCTYQQTSGGERIEPEAEIFYT